MGEITVRVIAMLLLSISLFKVCHAQQNKSDYDLAKAALAQNDCNTAIQYLKKYREEHMEMLNDHSEFLESIDKQIRICEDQIERKEESKAIIASEKQEVEIRAAVGNNDRGERAANIREIFRSMKGSF